MSTESISWFQYFMTICNTVFHQLVAVVTVFILWVIIYNLDINSTFTWHVILSTAAYMPLMSEAIVLFASENVWTRNISRTTRYKIHAVFLFDSAILATVGISFMIKRKSDHESVHFESIHAITGLVSWILVLLSQFLGCASFYSQTLKNIIRPVYIKFVHNLLGMVGFILGIVSLCYGIQKNTFDGIASDEARNACIVILAIVAFWTCIAAIKSGINQMKTIAS